MRYKNKNLINIIIVLFICILGINTAAYAAEQETDDFDYSAVDENVFLSDDERYYMYINPDTGYKAVVEDDADRLTDDEEYNLLYYMYEVTDYGDVYYKSIEDNQGYDSDEYARQYIKYDKMCAGSSGTVFLDDTVNRRLEIFSTGEIYKHITKGKAVSITDNVYQYASDGEYFECAAEAFYEMAVILNGGKIAEPMKVMSSIFLSVLISLLLCFIVAVATSDSVKATKAQMAQAANSDVKFSNVRKIFLNQKRIYNPPSSDSSSDSSSGGSSSGSSDSGGGGGGHSY